MGDHGEAATTLETSRPGNKKGVGSSDPTGKTAEVDPCGGDPGSREPLVTDGFGRGKSAAPGISSAEGGTSRGYIPMPTMEYWPFNPLTPGAGFDNNALGPLVPVLLPGPFPSYYPIPGQDQLPSPEGIFAVPATPMIGAMGTIPHSGFIPLSFNMPSLPLPVPADGQMREPDAGRAAPLADVREAVALNGLRQRPVAIGVRARQNPRAREPQRQVQVVRRFQVGFQLDLLLILKLAVVVIVFNQDGTKDRLMLLLLLAGFVYLYQTGALAPILRWISVSAQHAMMPPQQPLPAVDGGQIAEREGVMLPNVRDTPVGPEVREVPLGPPIPDGAVGQGEGPPGRLGEDDPTADQPPRWWGIFKELQMIVVGFFTSLLPGFQHAE